MDCLTHRPDNARLRPSAETGTPAEVAAVVEAAVVEAAVEAAGMAEAAPAVVEREEAVMAGTKTTFRRLRRNRNRRRLRSRQSLRQRRAC
jgi:hypothetical protein